MAILDDEEQRGLPDAVEPLRTFAGEVESEPENVRRLGGCCGRWDGQGDELER